ncbi:uncharacterized protein BDR25DRAFT_338939 [Lindgomyces ingoldianus]|uniref:Uncharacterized protein n=1 Tax=Lindgomyces ingoldianus TaxID=673940 RepID=A0ACB6RH35_9PLEO|nr:uncharacterized protein BDR25DRAFT_338939 [Lindgomyces ingoldianus]KAF2478380.1 hypothetical protein BDR25DRAFT_338939 [Lindgomyces ingoldianus]
MDPLSVSSAAVGLTRLLYDHGDGWHQILTSFQSFLKVIDIPLRKGGVPALVTTSEMDENCDGLEVLERTLDSLPEQGAHTCRVYIEENLGFRDEFKAHLEQLVPDSFPDMHTSPATNSFLRLASQWSATSQHTQPWSLETYDFDSSLKNRRLAPGSSLMFSAGLIRRTSKIRVASDASGRMIVFVSCMSEMMALEEIFKKFSTGDRTISRPTASTVFARLRTIGNGLTRLDRVYNMLHDQGVPEAVNRQLLLLRFCHAQLEQASAILDTIQLFYTAFRERLSDPRRVVITASSLEELTRDAHLYEVFHQSVSNLASSTESLLCVVGPSLSNQKIFHAHSTEIKCICEDLKKTSSSLLGRLENHLKFIELRKSLRESASVWLLSLLASIFLPLSLASSLLSMQTRLADLHFLLYDFCGVIVLLATIVGIVVLVLRLNMWWSDKLAKWDSNVIFRRRIRPIIGFSTWSWVFIAWGLALSSFLVGMIKDVGLGLRILGFGAAIIGGMLLLTASAAGLLWWLISLVY